MTPIQRSMTAAPNMISTIREDLLRFEDAPAAILSAPIKSSVRETTRIRVVIAAVGLNITKIDKTMAITPKMICNVPIPFEGLVSLILFDM